jgi:hypothetical protein
MAFQQQSAAPRPITIHVPESQESTSQAPIRPRPIEESQEWVLFSPGTAASTITRTQTSQTAGVSGVSDVSLNTAGRSRIESSVLDDEVTEDGELDSLDDGLHAFREPPLYPTTSNQTQGPLLPTHDGLGTFPASSPPVLEQLWQHEQYNPKRKHDGQHRRSSSVQRRLDTIDEIEAQASEEKRLRIEMWRMEQSQALIDEVEKETRRRLRRGSQTTTHQDTFASVNEDLLGSTPKQADYTPRRTADDPEESEPFWRRITKRFIRDVIGIDEPLLSVIFGESLPDEAYESRPSSSSALPTIAEQPTGSRSIEDTRWRDKLLQRIARELGVFVHQLSPHPGAFTAYSRSPDYAGMPVGSTQLKPQSILSPITQSHVRDAVSSALTPNFQPTIQDPAHAESWGFEDDNAGGSPPLATSSNLQQEREYWERELDLKMVFRYLRDKFVTRPSTQPLQVSRQPLEDAATRTAIIRQHHPLVNRAQRSPMRMRRDSRASIRRPTSSCASESVRSSRKASLVRSGSSRNYWDIGGSVGSGSILASGGHWGEV